MEINWLNLGYVAVQIVVTGILTLVSGAFLYRRYVQDEIVSMLESTQEAINEAAATSKRLASLAGVKGQEYAGAKNLEKEIASDLVNQNIPELQALKMLLTPSMWEKVEEAIENNPEQVLQLYQRYKPLLQGKLAQKKPEEQSFDFG